MDRPTGPAIRRACYGRQGAGRGEGSQPPKNGPSSQKVSSVARHASSIHQTLSQRISPAYMHRFLGRPARSAAALNASLFGAGSMRENRRPSTATASAYAKCRTRSPRNRTAWPVCLIGNPLEAITHGYAKSSTSFFEPSQLRVPMQQNLPAPAPLPFHRS